MIESDDSSYSLENIFGLDSDDNDILYHFAACQIQAVYRGHYARCHSVVSQLTVLAFDAINKKWVETNRVRLRERSACASSVTTDVGDNVWCDNDSESGSSECCGNVFFRDVQSPTAKKNFILETDWVDEEQMPEDSRHAEPPPANGWSFMNVFVSSPTANSPAASPTKKSPATSPVRRSPTVSPRGSSYSPLYPVLESGAPSFEHWTQTVVIDSPISSRSSVSGNEAVCFDIPLPPPMILTGTVTPTAVVSPAGQTSDPFDVCTELAATEIQALYRGYFTRSRVACEEVAHLQLWAEAISEMRSFRRAVDEVAEEKSRMERLKAEKAESKRRFLERQALKAEKAESKRQFLERRRAAAEKEKEKEREKENIAHSSEAVGWSDIVGQKSKAFAVTPGRPDSALQSLETNGQSGGPVAVVPGSAAQKRRFPYVPLHTWDEFLEAVDEQDFSLHCAAAEIQAMFRGVHARQHRLSAEVAHIEMWREAIQEMRALRQQSDRQAEEALAAEAVSVLEEERLLLQRKVLVATRLQAMCRGHQTRKAVVAGLALWMYGGPMAVRIQARFRGYRARKLLNNQWATMTDCVVKIQALFREWRDKTRCGPRPVATRSVTKDTGSPVAVVPGSAAQKRRFPYVPLHTWDEFLEAVDEQDFSLHCAAAEIQAMFRGVHARQHRLSAEVAHISIWRATIAEIREFRAEQERLLELVEAEARCQAAELALMRVASEESRRYEAECIKFAVFLEQSAAFVRLQACVRGALCRSNLRLAREARTLLCAARRIQALFRGCRLRAQRARAERERILMEFESELAVGAMRAQFALEAYVAAESAADAVYKVEVIRLENESEAHRLAEEAVAVGDRAAVRERAAAEEKLTAIVGSEVEHILLLRSLAEEEPLPEPLLWAEEEAERLGEEADAMTEKLILQDQECFCGQKGAEHRSVLVQQLSAVDCEQARSAAVAAADSSERVMGALRVDASPRPVPEDPAASLLRPGAFERAVATARMNREVAERETRHLERQAQVHRAVAVTRERQVVQAKREAAQMAMSALAIQSCFRAIKAWRELDRLKRARRFEEEEEERLRLEKEALLAAEEEALEFDSVVEETIRADQTSFCSDRHVSHREQLLQKIEAAGAVRERVKQRLLDEAIPRTATKGKPVDGDAESENAPVSSLQSTAVFEKAVSRAQSLRDAAAKELLRLTRQKSVHIASLNARAQREVSSKIDLSLQKQSARRIQNCYRALVEHRRRIAAAEAELMALTLRVQMAYRSYKARCVVARLRFEASQLVMAKQVRHAMLIRRLQTRFRRRRARRLLESEAALPIQCMYRCFKARRMFGKRIEELEMQEMDKQVRVAVLVSRLQARFRGRKARRELEDATQLYDEFVRQELTEVQHQQEELAATHIQAAFRGYEIRNYFRSCIQHAMSASFVSTSSGCTNISSLLSIPECDESDSVTSPIPAAGVTPMGFGGQSALPVGDQHYFVLEQQRLALEAAASVEQAKLELERLKREKLMISREAAKREKVRLAKRFRRIRTVKRSTSGKVASKERPAEDLLVTETDEL